MLFTLRHFYLMLSLVNSHQELMFHKVRHGPFSLLTYRNKRVLFLYLSYTDNILYHGSISSVYDKTDRKQIMDPYSSIAIFTIASIYPQHLRMQLNRATTVHVHSLCTFYSVDINTCTMQLAKCPKHYADLYIVKYRQLKVIYQSILVDVHTCL